MTGVGLGMKGFCQAFVGTILTGRPEAYIVGMLSYGMHHFNPKENIAEALLHQYESQ